MRPTLRGSRDRSAWFDALGRRLRLDDDRWHDGRLVAFSVETGQRGLKGTFGATLRAEVYGDGTRARRRTPLTVTFGGVREVITTLSGRELVDMGNDHIVFARLNETSDMLDLSIHLAGGHIRIVAERCAVSTRLGRRRISARR
ncbi:MAG: hypothetical protein ABIU38_12960 [Vicinamibacteraceae bacterium]